MALRPDRDQVVTGDACTVDRPEWHTFLMGALALTAAVFAVLVDGASVPLVGFLALGLVPWAIVLAGVRMPLWLFDVATFTPVGLAVLTGAPGPIFFAMITVLFVTSQTRNRSLIGFTVVSALVLPLLCSTQQDDQDMGNWYFAAGILFSWLAGHLLRRQYELVAELRAAQDRIGALAAADERRRIAREIHDIVAHSLTVVVLNVGGARKAMAVNPDAASEALERAEQVGRQALDDIRRTVGLLRDDAEREVGSDNQVAPTAATIPLLVQGYEVAGLDVALEVEGDFDALDPVTGSTLYRFVQEGLSNVLVHAPGAPVTVTIELGHRGVEATVRNGAPSELVATESHREGLGLIGMRERIESRRGSFSAGPDGGGWLITCSLPTARGRLPVSP